MLVESYEYDHLLPNSSGPSSAFNSAASSSYIPHISYDDFTHPQDFNPQPSSGISARQNRRMRSAPYPLSISTNVSYQQGQQQLSDSFAFQQNTSHLHIPLHSPRPQVYFNAAEAFDNHNQNIDANVNINASSQHVHSPLAFTPGAHGTILGPFASESESPAYPAPGAGELTATQMAYMQPSVQAPSPTTTPPASSYSRLNQARAPGSSSLPQIQMPQVPCVPQVPAMPPPPVLSLSTHDLPASTMPNNKIFVPDAVPPEPSQSFISHTGPFVPPAKTFQTPSELLADLSLRDADEQKNLRRREERRIIQRVLGSPSLGFTATDPETIPIHSKKRYYLDCLEQYVVYLHNQLRLIGVEPVPVERVSAGRGLTSRSIRTMIVHLKSETAKLHVQKNAAEIKYEELRAQLGADADSAAPLFTAPMGSGAGASYPDPSLSWTRNRNQTMSNSGAHIDIDSTNVHSGGESAAERPAIDRRRHSIAIGEPYSGSAPTAAHSASANLELGYCFL